MGLSTNSEQVKSELLRQLLINHVKRHWPVSPLSDVASGKAGATTTDGVLTICPTVLSVLHMLFH